MPSPSLNVNKNTSPQDPHAIVRAGAGAGKTYTLTHKVMDLADQSLKARDRLPRLIVTTFTRKATEELRERLMLLALEEKPHLLDFVNSRSQLVVSTIHGVMDLFLKRHGTTIGIDPSYRIIGTQEASKLARQTLRRVLFETSDEGATNAQKELLESFPFNLLAKLVRRIDGIAAQTPSAQPFQFDDFAEIFRKRSARLSEELKEVGLRIREEATKENWQKMAEMFLELGRLLALGDWAKHRAPFAALSDELQVVRRNPKGAQPVSDLTMELARAARTNARDLIDPLYDPEAWKIFAAHYETIHSVARRFGELFRKSKREQGLLEIGDLELLAMTCARENPEAVASFSQEWDHWLIDEYQDTSPFQVELLRRLTGASPTFVVGDPQQSIYLFRGARSEVFAERESQVEEGGGERHFLRVNRRSRPELLLFINQFFAGFDPPFAAMDPHYGEGATASTDKPVVAKIYIAPDAKKEAKQDAREEDAGEPVEAESEGREREMRALVQHVQGLIAGGARPEEICVLGRTNRTLTEAAELLSLYQIPVHVHAASGFYDRREIRDALSLLRFLVNPHDGFNLVELLRSPWFRVPDRDIVEAARRRKQAAAPSSLWETLVTGLTSAAEFEAIHRLQALIRAAFANGLTETFRKTLIDAGFIDFAHLHDVSGRREANIWKLMAKLQQEECKPGFNPIEFVQAAFNELKLDEGNAEGDAVAAIEPNRVNLMTVHASKGLEFAHVCLPCMDQKPRLTTHEEFTFDEHQGKWALRAPFGEHHEMTRSLPEDEWLQEFRVQELREHARVLYVALTRASQTLFLSWTGDPKASSWAAMTMEKTEMNFAEGRHEGRNYSYEVSRTEPELLPLNSLSATQIELRSPWHATKSHGAETPRSVSELLEEAQEGAAFTIESGRDMTQLLRLATQGTAVHRLVELLKYPSREKLEFLVERWFPSQTDRVLKAISFVREAKDPPLAELIENGEVEWGFSFFEPTVAGGIIVEGQVDLWGKTAAGEVWIVDYKTGNPKYREKAFAQMALYALAVRRSGRIKEHESIRLAAVYPFTNEIYTVPEPPLSSVLELLQGKKPSGKA